jgi:conjugative transfer signal peptidase TraF
MSRARCPSGPPRWRVVILTFALATAVIVAASAAGSHFVWNLSPSLPPGLYRLERGGVPSPGAIVAFEPPFLAAALISERGYLPRGAALLKELVAIGGDRVCIGEVFSVNGQAIGAVLTRDSAGRPLKPYRFCGVVLPGSAFVATPAPRSFDSRYFGPLPLRTLTPARPVWTF